MTAKAVDMGFKTVKVLSEPVEIHLEAVGVTAQPVGPAQKSRSTRLFCGQRRFGCRAGIRRGGG